MQNLFLFLVFFLFVAFVFSSYCYYEQKKVNFTEKFLTLNAKNIVFIFLIVLVPAIFVTFRSETTGVDTIRYITVLDYPKEYLTYRMIQSREYLYYFFCLFSQQFDSIRLLFFLLAITPLLFVFVCFYKISPCFNPFVSSFLFLLLFYEPLFNATRQMPAIALVFFSYTFCLSRRFISFLICILAAMFFHSSAICALPLYFLYPRNTLNSFDYIKKTFFFIIVLVGISIILKYVLTMDFFSRYALYSEGLFQVSSFQSIMNFFVNYSFVILLMFFFSIGILFKNEDDEKNFHFLWIVTIIFCLVVLFRFVQSWLFRVGFYYQLGEILIVSRLCSKIQPPKQSFLANYTISAPDILVLVMVIISYFMYHIRYYDQSALINFSLIG